jgi:hypothetical protein
MPVHLPNENYITYNAGANMAQILSEPLLRKTILTEWFVTNTNHHDARELTYCEFPSRWLWNEKTKSWQRRRSRESKIGRLYYIHPSAGEKYYLRRLLLIVKGACSYESLRTYNNIVFPHLKKHVKHVVFLMMIKNG